MWNTCGRSWGARTGMLIPSGQAAGGATLSVYFMRHARLAAGLLIGTGLLITLVWFRRRRLVPLPTAPLRVLVYGAGVQGSLYAARLHGRGHEVTLLARGTRLSELRAHGVELDDLVSGQRYRSTVSVTERLDPEDSYDLALVTVRRDQIDSVLPALAASQVPTIVFFHNHANGSESLTSAVGAGRVLLGFPGAGGSREVGGRVRYALIAQQPTTLGEPSGKRTPRLEQLAGLLRDAGFPVETSLHMDAWLRSHAVFVTAVSGALYQAGGHAAALAASPESVLHVVRAVGEGFRALRALGLAGHPLNLRVIFEWVPPPLAALYWRRFFSLPLAEDILARHARVAGGEMLALVRDLQGVIGPDEVPALRGLWAAVERSVEDQRSAGSGPLFPRVVLP